MAKVRGCYDCAPRSTPWWRELRVGRNQESPTASHLRGPRLIKLRDDYERIFVDLTSVLSIISPLAKRYERLMNLGSMNSTPTWYGTGCDEPEEIAKAFVPVLHYGETP